MVWWTTDTYLMAGAIQDGNTQFDLNGDQQMDLQDQNELVTGILNTWIGDSNLDGSFDSSDFVLVFTAGKFETEAAATWSEGDWNADGLFNSADLVRAFSDGGFERGMRSVQSVPEPTSFVQLVGLLVGWVWVRKCRE